MQTVQARRTDVKAVHAELVTRACRLIEDSEVTPKLTRLATVLGLSSGYLHRIFKAQTGLTPRNFATAHRTKRLREALVSGLVLTTWVREADDDGAGDLPAVADRLFATHHAVQRKL